MRKRVILKYTDFILPVFFLLLALCLWQRNDETAIAQGIKGIYVDSEMEYGPRSAVCLNITMNNKNVYQVNSATMGAFDRESFLQDVKKGDSISIEYKSYKTLWGEERYDVLGLEAGEKQYIDNQKRLELEREQEQYQSIIIVFFLALGLLGIIFSGVSFWKRTYDVKEAHKFSSYHKAQLMEGEKCGCFYCLKIFSPAEIEDWTDEGKTALCPYCSVDAVLGENSGYPINKKFLGKMNRRWFAQSNLEK